ncbi:MAG TPA: M20 family metallopeptidase [Thermomicrobiales bacterium]|nr:M20 family metallopeptidase [Thermomicrobiales bacterium]HRA31009.1 M20 family metallopeptidase [Thermomicrobiales bacterium]
MTATIGMDEARERIAAEARALHPRLVAISQDLHAHPELSFEEHHAAALLTGELEEHGFEVERGTAGMETAFIATYGSGEPVVAILAEYDALPKLGHACGHNLIATWGVGAGIALRRALPDISGTIKVIGTPAEEGGGGKVIMAEAGIFNGIDAVMMMHPRDTTYADRGSLAIAHYEVAFHGKASHASSAPENGINALDALLQVYFSINQLRQAFPPQTRIHGIITHGGDAANIIPDYAAGSFLVRANDQTYHEKLKQQFRDICEAAALATGARVEIDEGIGYKQRVCNSALVETFRDNLERLGIACETPTATTGVGSSDIGDVSQLVPTIHPYLQICDKGTSGHTTGFAEAAGSARADGLTVTGATLLAWTAAEVLLRPELREQLRLTFREQIGRDPAR